MAEYINISNSNTRGVTSVSSHAIRNMVNYVLEDLAFIETNNESKDINSKKKAILTEPVNVMIKDNSVSIKISLNFRKEINATLLSQEIQKEVYDNFINMTEYSNVKVDIKIGGIF